MRSSIIAIALWGVLVSVPVETLADDQGGAPLAPTDAKGPWTLASGDRTICVLDLGEEKVGAASFALTVPLACGDAVPTDAVAWTPTTYGVRLVRYDGHPIMGFTRLNNGLLLAHRSSGDLLLTRVAPNPSGLATASNR